MWCPHRHITVVLANKCIWNKFIVFRRNSNDTVLVMLAHARAPAVIPSHQEEGKHKMTIPGL